MTLLPETALSELGWLGQREQKALAAAGMSRVSDVLMRIPRRYEDRRRSGDVAALADGDTACLQLHVYSAGWRYARQRFFEVSAGASGNPNAPRLLLRWFRMPYVAKLLAVGMNICLYGKVHAYGGKLSMINPDFEVLEEEDAGQRLVILAMGGAAPPLAAPSGAQELIHTGRLVPIYRSIGGMSARNYRALVHRLLRELPAELPPPLCDIAPAYPWRQALEDIHFPAEESAAQKARLRLALGECFVRQFCVAWRRLRSQSRPGQVTAVCDAYVQELLEHLPYRLTGAQQRCLREIRADMAAPRQMNRLLQGDVGSGKTLVALCAMLLALGSGKSAALLAPTQILAEQHYRNFCRLLAHTDVPLSLRTGDRIDDTGLVLEGSESDSGPRLIVGTHALLYNKHRPKGLGLAVIDEQHKFGVDQREQFIRSGESPDVLVMTATPIPRTLTLTLYGDLDVSVIDELPAGRGSVTTVTRHPEHLRRLVSFMQRELTAGRQAYIVSPLVEDSEKQTRASAVSELERWSALFPECRLGLLHGRLAAEEKDSVMRAFAAGETQLLVATTVVEVGVDVPNATIMVINDADSFGLTQLHQLRGRIGRGGHSGWCILLSRCRPGEAGREKLDILCRTTNGFEIAEEDFRLRGPGDVLGTAQSGAGSLQFPEAVADLRLIHRADREARAILDADPELLAPQHARLRELVAGSAETRVTS
ncbi:MAG: ATP-dependent DNA helicase RecG [Akkermansia sp.]